MEYRFMCFLTNSVTRKVEHRAIIVFTAKPFMVKSFAVEKLEKNNKWTEEKSEHMEKKVDQNLAQKLLKEWLFNGPSENNDWIFWWKEKKMTSKENIMWLVEPQFTEEDEAEIKRQWLLFNL